MRGNFNQVRCRTKVYCTTPRHGAEQYAGDLKCVFYGYHLDRAILKIAEAAYCLMPSLTTPFHEICSSSRSKSVFKLCLSMNVTLLLEMLCDLQLCRVQCS